MKKCLALLLLSVVTTAFAGEQTISVTDYGLVANTPGVKSANTTALKKLISPSNSGGSSTFAGKVKFPNPGGTDTYYFNPTFIEVRDDIAIDCQGATLDFAGSYDAGNDTGGFLTFIRDVSVENCNINVDYDGKAGTNNGSALRIGARAGSYGFGRFQPGLEEEDLTEPMGNVIVRKVHIRTNNPDTCAIQVYGGLRNTTIQTVTIDGTHLAPTGICYEFGQWHYEGGRAGDANISTHATNFRVGDIHVSNITGTAVWITGAMTFYIDGLWADDASTVFIGRLGEAGYYNMKGTPTEGMKAHYDLHNVNGKNISSTGISLLGSEDLTRGYLGARIKALPVEARAQAQTDKITFNLDGFDLADSNIIVNSSNVRLANGTQKNGGVRGIWLQSETTHFEIENVNVLDNDGAGIASDTGGKIYATARSRNGSIHNCFVAGSGADGGNDAGIALSQMDGVLIDSCRFGYELAHDGRAEMHQGAGVSNQATSRNVTVRNSYGGGTTTTMFTNAASGGSKSAKLENVRGTATVSGQWTRDHDGTDGDIGDKTATSDTTAALAAADPHSYAEPAKFLVKHVALDLTAFFEAHRLKGTVDLTVEQKDPTADTLNLDTRDLEIESVHLLEASGREAVLAFKLGERDPILGSKLSITFPHCCSATPQMRIRIAYRTSSEANALQWLDPAQTFGTKPYVFSQGQAIRTRSWIPLQDSPAVRVTYSARLKTPPELVAVMSAARVAQPGDGPGEYRFEMRQPIPSYLIAFAIGDLKFHAFSDRTGTWTETSRLAAAAYEFEDLPRMLAAGEKLAGPYRWDRYDVLIMPRSFPYGGMENPRLSFISPSIIAGDRSLVSTVVHELAHSWSGNLVTMDTWNDFWLNEGFTSYLERRMSEELYGKRFADMEDVISYGELVQAIEDLNRTGQAKDSSLKQVLAGRDPEEGSTDIVYEKTRWFLGFLEGRYGRSAFDAFLRGYFDAHAFQSVDTETFRAWLFKDLERPDAPKITAAEIDAWLYGPGLPPTMPAVPTGVFDALDRTAADWRGGKVATANLPVKDWVPMEWVRFLDEQPADLPRTKLADLRSTFHLSSDGNAEIALAWLQLVIRNGYEPAYPDLERYLTETGRWRLVVTLYTDLARTPAGLELGRRIYAKAKPSYHASIRGAVERLLYPGVGQPASAG